MFINSKKDYNGILYSDKNKLKLHITTGINLRNVLSKKNQLK